MHHVDAQLQLSNLGSWLTRTDRQKDYSFWLIFTHIGWYGRNIRMANISAWILEQIQLSSWANIIYNCNKYNLRTNSTGSEIAVRQRARNCTNSLLTAPLLIWLLLLLLSLLISQLISLLQLLHLSALLKHLIHLSIIVHLKDRFSQQNISIKLDKYSSLLLRPIADPINQSSLSFLKKMDQISLDLQ